ncbi:Gpi16 subunit, GPI transamidase component [Auriculariales sp. MPI-PUGE-AT-0066]|nr:Gpi16 subunit, GPI transamidase component [Auriculariales sp. MPI-PUGE-AT-0066]
MKPRLGIELALLVAAVAAERFDERLDFKSLPNRRVLAHWTFTTTDTDFAQPHYTLFPLGLGQILTTYDVSELHLAMNAGQWDYPSWGAPPGHSVASGAEMWAWLRSSPTATRLNITQDIDSRWSGLRSAIAGVFCASLGKLDGQRTIVPEVSFKPTSPLPAGRHQIRHATLPAEIVCTENLTPFIKLLPCKASAGVASLLNPHAMFAAPFHGLSVHFAGGVLTMSAQVVFTSNTVDWTLKSLLSRQIKTACPVASSSVLALAPGDEPSKTEAEARQQSDGAAHFDISTVATPFDLTMTPSGASVAPVAPVVMIQRTITGSAQYNGGLSINLFNTRNETVKIAYLESLPWFMTIYLSTLEVKLGGKLRPDLLETLRYHPSSGRAPAHFEPTLVLPPLGQVTLKCAMDRAFLLYTQHPPDAQRGWDLPPAIITVLSIGQDTSIPPQTESGRGLGRQAILAMQRPLGGDEKGSRIYAKTLLADLPTPDFSMPYNVIIMSSTLIALLFGNIFNVLTRPRVIVQVEKLVVEETEASEAKHEAKPNTDS